MCFDTRSSQNTDTEKHTTRIPTSQPPSPETGAWEDVYLIEMATLFETFKSFLSYTDKSKKLGDSVEKAMLCLAGNGIVKRMIDAEDKSWSKRKCCQFNSMISIKLR